MTPFVSSQRSGAHACDSGLWFTPVAVAVLVAWGSLSASGVRGSEPAPERDWGQVRLAWRDDPRPPADVPGSVEQTSRRQSRRSQRRAAAQRRMATEEASHGLRPTGLDAVAASTLSPVADGKAGPDRRAAVAHRDIPYGPSSDRYCRFDMHLPAACSGGGLPLVVWIRDADGRTVGRREADCPVRWLVARGYAVASIACRSSETAVFPAQLDDCHIALETIRDAADLWGIDPERICVVGAGAGGQLAALVGFDGRDVAAICTVAAPAHLVSLGPTHDRPGSAASRLVGGPLTEFREVALAASPLTHVTAEAPPTLVVHGSRDTCVPCEQGRRLAGALEAAGVDGTLVVVDAGHDVPLDENTPGGRALVTFLDRVLDAGVRPAEGGSEPPG